MLPTTDYEKARAALRDIERQGRQSERDRRALERGYTALGFSLDHGSQAPTALTYRAPSWYRAHLGARPAGLPDALWTRATAIADTYDAARQAQATAHAEARRETSEMPDVLRASKYQELTWKQDKQYKEADQQLAGAAQHLGNVIVALDAVAQLEAQAPAQRAAADQRYQAELHQIDGTISQARMALKELISQ